jgi:hypothetical protein
LARKYGVTAISISRIRNGHQGVVFHRAQHEAQARFPGVEQPQRALHPADRVLERVPSIQLPIVGEVR